MVDVLFICTGNLCRSPSAAWFLGQRINRYGPPDVTVESAGTLGSLAEIPEKLILEGEAFGLNFNGHVSRKVDREAIARADLIIGMAREHVREIVLADNPSFSKTFTLREFVRRGEEAGPRPADESLEEWLLHVGASRRHIDLIGDSPLDDTPDPMGGFSEDYRRMLEEVDALTSRLHALVWPLPN
jgi:protein-tyrosine phosphatase